MFEVYKKRFEIQGVSYEIEPLDGEDLPTLFQALKRMEAFMGDGLEDATEEQKENVMKEVLSKLDPDALGMLHQLTFKTFVSSYPSQDKKKLQKWVTQNIMELFPHIIEVNLNSRQ